MDASKLKEILDQHRLWLNGKGGKCAYFYRAKLTGAKLTRADLFRANLHGANLTRADLFRANLRDACLRDANLTGADLEGADLINADLIRADLRGANLKDANLTGADLQYANLKDAILPDVSWIIPGCLVQLNGIKLNGFWLMKERKLENFVQDSFGFFIQNNLTEKTFDMLVEDRVIRGIPHWVKYSGMKQIATESV